MRQILRPAAAAVALLAWSTAALADGRDLRLQSADGAPVTGWAESPTKRPRLVVIFVPGTGLFDRDGAFGVTGTPRDYVFKDLAARMGARGIATIRYDVRGVRYAPTDKADRALLAGRTTTAMRDDLAAIYRFARAPDGVGADCVAFFAHSEGMLHVARMAAAGEPAPALVIGMGAAMESPVDVVRWQISGRDADSLELMDADRDGVTTNEEVRANLAATPSGVHAKLEPFLHPAGRWTREDLATLRATQAEIYDRVRKEVLTHADGEPYPDATTAFAAYQWWKSWFVDEEPTARHLAHWPTPVSLHYGDRDSQTPAARQIAAARAILPPERLRTIVHADRGHTLGEHVLLGPIDIAIAEQVADEAAAAMATCKPG